MVGQVERWRPRDAPPTRARAFGGCRSSQVTRDFPLTAHRLDPRRLHRVPHRIYGQAWKNAVGIELRERLLRRRWRGLVDVLYRLLMLRAAAASRTLGAREGHAVVHHLWFGTLLAEAWARARRTHWWWRRRPLAHPANVEGNHRAATEPRHVACRAAGNLQLQGARRQLHLIFERRRCL